MNNAVSKNYIYSINVGAPNEYEMVFDFDQNYLTNQDGTPLLPFTAVGGSPSIEWGNGTQASLLSENNPLPYGIKVRWFSVAENQFWEGKYQFNQDILEKLSQHTVNNVLTRRKTPFMNFFEFTVYTVPGGLVTIWISGAGETHLLGQFQSYKVDEKDWDSFAKKALQRRIYINREDYIEERFTDPDSAMSNYTKQQREENRIPKSFIPWQRLMQTHPWTLTVNDEFQLKDYWAWYINGEKLFTYSADNQTEPKSRPIPYFISFYIEANTEDKTLNRMNISFDREEIIKGFEKLAENISPTNDEGIRLHLSVDPALNAVDAYLIKGNTSVELEKIEPSLEDLYRGTN